VDVTITPEEIKGLVAPEQYQLYRLIWTRFVASQMAAARVQDTIVLARCREVIFRAKGERVLFPGFYVLSPQRSEDAVELPPLSPGQPLALTKLHKEQKFTQPPARYTEASLVRELEEKGIGRPSTYASIIATLLDREYARLEDKHFTATDLGAVVCDLLTNSFRDLMDVGFTAQMEESLDRVADGGQDWVDLLRRFSETFNPTLDTAARTMESVKAGLPSDLACPDCGKETLIRFGKAGPFLACSGYPSCRFTSNFTRDEQGRIHLAEKEKIPAEVMGVCPDCGADLVLKRSRTGSRFVACSAWPACKHAEPFSTGVPCPRCRTGRLVEKSSKRGKIFYSCDQYPACDYALWDTPVQGPCPLCGFPVLCRKTLRGKTTVFCPEKKCRYRRDESEADES
jgi:DNA topoisomerase-1